MIKTSYVLPAEYYTFERSSKFLFLDPRNFVWFVTNREGKTVLDEMARSGSADRAASCLGRFVGKDPGSPAVTEYISRFIHDLVQIRFLYRGAYKAEEWGSGVGATPTILYLHLTFQCNLHCPYCYNRSHRDRLLSKPSHGRSSLQDLLRIVDEAADLGFTEIKLTGGEPLLSRHAFEVADRAKRRGLWVNLLTNATLVTPERAARLAEVIDSVSISLDSDQADVHDAVRGRGTYRRILEAVKSLKQCGVTVLHVNCVVTPVNLGSTAKFLDFAWNILGANKVTVGEAIPAVGDSEKSTEKYLLSSNERQQLTQIIREFDEGRLSSGACVQARTDMWRRHCGAGNGEISVDPNGDVYPCQTMHLPEFFCGNAFESGLKAVLQSEVLGKMKTLVVDNLPECRKCAVRYICAGACRCEAYLREGDLSARPREMCPVLFERCVDALWNAAAIPVERSAEALERYRTEQCGLEHGDIVRAVANSSQ